MQPQSEINSKCKFKSQQQQQLPATPTIKNTTTRRASILQQKPTTAAATAHEVTKRSPAVKVVKCKKPLCHFKFYLDICDHQLAKRIEEQIKLLGGTQEFFLTPSVTHFVTDKQSSEPTVATATSVTNNSLNPNVSCPGTPQTPQTPLTPLTPFSVECLAADSTKSNNGLANKKHIRNSRADAILNKARRLSTIIVSSPTTSHLQSKSLPVDKPNCSTPPNHKDYQGNNDTGTQPLPYVVWQCEIALRFFKKVQHELKDYLDQSNKSKIKCYAIEPISLKGGFIKFESLKRNYRPYYHLFRKPQEWPKIQLSREDGAFRLSPKKDLPLKDIEEIDRIPQTIDGGAFIDNMTRKSRTKSSQNHHNNNLKNKGNDLIKSPANSQKQLAKCKNQTPQHQKDSTDKQCGVCEICKIEYDALTIHLKTKDHEYFAKNSQNFMSLDSLIHASADVNKFLDENRKLEIKTELEEMEVEHEGLIVIEQDPLQHSENENQNDDDDEDIEGEEDDDDEESQKSSSTTKRKSTEPKVASPTLREKSKRSTKGKHSSEKFQNCSFSATAKAPKTSSPQKHLGALDVKNVSTRKKPSAAAALSPPIRAMLPPNSMYKVVETHAEVNCTPPRGKCLATGLNDESKAVGSPSIIVKFKKVLNRELRALNGEAENFMFPKKRRDSSELLTDIDRQTTSDRIHHTQSSQQILTSSSSEEQDADEEDFGVKGQSLPMEHSGKKATVKGTRRLSKISSSSASKSTLGGKTKQSFPKTPIQPNKQLKNEPKSTTAMAHTKKRKSAPASAPTPRNHIAKIENVTAIVTVPNKIVLPEATRKSSRTATAIVTAATTSTRLLQAAVEAAKSKQKLETSIKSKLPLVHPLAKQMQIKQELHSEQEMEDENEDGSVVLKTASKSKKLRCRRKPVVKMEDRMGDTIKKPRHYLNKSKLLHCFDADDYEDYEDDITLDEYCCDDDEKDEDFILQPSKGRTKLSSKLTKQAPDNVSFVAAAAKITPTSAKSVPKSKRSSQTTLPNRSVREERLARRQSRLITQLQLELQTCSEEEHVKEFPKPKAPDKKIEKIVDGKQSSKAPLKVSKHETAPKRGRLKASPTKQEPAPPSRYFDHTKSEHLKAMRYAFERLPVTDLWYRVYKRQDNCEEKYFEYFGSTKYRKLPYELGPIPFDSTLLDCKEHKIYCQLCVGGGQKGDKIENDQKLQVRRELQLDLKEEPSVSPNIKPLESQQHQVICSSSSGHNKNQQEEQGNKDQEHSKLNCSSQSTETKSYTHKHKKLHLLQRYRQELEQQELLQRQKLEEESKSGQAGNVTMLSNAEIKMEAATQDCLPPSRNDRAGSIHSNASSCASSANTNCKTKKTRNKLLNKATFLANLELPPRKSPREHASTLALVSCIIKQRQDSLSKPNSETDEPPVTPADMDPNVLPIGGEPLNVSELVGKEPSKTNPPLARKTSAESPIPNVLSSPRTRSQAATPVEELRFATEISETVKRMRRGRNKYDYSPPFVQRMAAAPSSARGRRKNGPNTAVLFGSRQKFTTSKSSLGSFSKQKRSIPSTKLQSKNTGKVVLNECMRRTGRQKKAYMNLAKNPETVLSSIRKTGSKKGVLEFEVDNIAIEALKKVTADYVNPKLLEWQVDKFLTLANKEYGRDLLLPPIGVAAATEVIADISSHDVQSLDNVTPAIDDIVLNTPPATDYFSSDFDLCDIIDQSCERLQEDHNGSHFDRKSKKFSIFNTCHLNKYYRKRKNPKTNRTGWPKAPKKKAITRQQSTQDKIYFLQNGNVVEDKIELKNDVIENNEAGNDETTQEQTRESGVITPPDSENDIEDDSKHNKIIKIEEEDDESLLLEDDSHIAPNEGSQTPNEEDGDENCDEEDEDEVDECERPGDDDETLADSVDADDDAGDPDGNYYDDDDDDDDDEEEEGEEEEEDEQREQKADSDADADIEEAEEDEERTTRDNVLRKCMEFKKKVNKKCKKTVPKIIENDDEDSYEPQEKRLRGFPESPDEKLRINLLNPNSAHTSTPTTTPFMRALRRTPQLNGSLGSCFSPSEKAGDNSDIFTVSSDGLDTDMDLSNSHSQLRSTTNVDIDDEDHHHHHHSHHYHHQYQHQHHNTSLHNNSSSMVTPRRKFDISKYAPTNAAICAAEAATAAVKSLAISQFLKKEVRVTCRRLRAPFRRFRYRR